MRNCVWWDGHLVMASSSSSSSSLSLFIILNKDYSGPILRLVQAPSQLLKSSASLFTKEPVSLLAYHRTYLKVIATLKQFYYLSHSVN